MKMLAILILIFVGHLNPNNEPIYYAWKSEGQGMITSSVIQLNKGKIKIHYFPKMGGMESLKVGTYNLDKKTNRIDCLIKETYSFSHNTGTFALVDKNCSIKKTFKLLEGNKLQEINFNEIDQNTSKIPPHPFNKIYSKSEEKETITQMKVATELFKKYNGSPRVSK